jgi:hypothetical protein
MESQKTNFKITKKWLAENYFKISRTTLDVWLTEHPVDWSNDVALLDWIVEMSNNRRSS